MGDRFVIETADAAAMHAAKAIHSSTVSPVSSQAITPHASTGTSGDCPSFHEAIVQPKYRARAETLASTASFSNVPVIANTSVTTD